MGVGDPPSTLEAAYVLRGPIAAGSWHVVGDGILSGAGVMSVTVQFDVRLRPQAAVADELDQVVLSVVNTFQRSSDPQKAYAPILYETTAPGVAAAAMPGDRLVLRVRALAGDPGGMYLINGEGDGHGQYPGARVPRLDLPAAGQP